MADALVACNDDDVFLNRSTLTCARALVGRIIGKNGTTVKGIQLFTSTLIEIDRVSEPSTVVVLGTSEASAVALSMISDILSSNFKGFKMLRELGSAHGPSSACGESPKEGPFVYCPGVGMFPQRQVSCPRWMTLKGSNDTSIVNFCIHHFTTRRPTITNSSTARWDIWHQTAIEAPSCLFLPVFLGTTTTGSK
jgi:predicted RNA-binding protein YlqC (UPF0109 family)